MIENDRVYFKVGDFNVSLEIQGSKIVEASAAGPDGVPYKVDFAFEDSRILTPKCKICRWVLGEYICQDIECGVLVGAPSSAKGD